MIAIQVSLDDGESWRPIQSVRIQVIEDEVEAFDLHFNFTKEGIITDVVDVHGDVVGTSVQEYDDLIDSLIMPNSERDDTD